MTKHKHISPCDLGVSPFQQSEASAKYTVNIVSVCKRKFGMGAVCQKCNAVKNGAGQGQNAAC